MLGLQPFGLNKGRCPGACLARSSFLKDYYSTLQCSHGRSELAVEYSNVLRSNFFVLFLVILDGTRIYYFTVLILVACCEPGQVLIVCYRVLILVLIHTWKPRISIVRPYHLHFFELVLAALSSSKLANPAQIKTVGTRIRSRNQGNNNGYPLVLVPIFLKSVN